MEGKSFQTGVSNVGLLSFRDRQRSRISTNRKHHLRPSGHCLGPSWNHLGTILGHFGPSWGHLGPILGPSWASFGHLGPSWGHLGGLEGGLEGVWRVSWDLLGHLGRNGVRLRT